MRRLSIINTVPYRLKVGNGKTPFRLHSPIQLSQDTTINWKSDCDILKTMLFVIYG